MQSRFKSPVVWINAIAVIATLIVFFVPDTTTTIQVVVVAITSLISLFAGLNDPTSAKKF